MASLRWWTWGSGIALIATACWPRVRLRWQPETIERRCKHGYLRCECPRGDSDRGRLGIGAATCRLLADSGATILVVDLVADHAQAVADAITADGGIAVAFAGDVADESVAKAIVHEATKLVRRV